MGWEERDMRQVSIAVDVDDGLDGALRLLIDSQRFGFAVGSFSMTSKAGIGASVKLTVSSPGEIDAGQLAARLARHPTVKRIATEG